MTVHFSFDYWNTLAKPNKDYSTRRSQYLGEMLVLPPEEAKKAYTHVKTELDLAAELQGLSTSRNDNLQRLYRHVTNTDATDSWIYQVGLALDKIFMSHPPTISAETKNALIRAYQYGYTISIASNTNFIRGITLRETLKDLPFAFMLFSDEIGVSKPHKDFFHRIIGLTMHHNPRFVAARSIRHIGDHNVCDGAVLNFGMDFSKVEGAEDTAEVINSLIDQLQRTRDYK